MQQVRIHESWKEVLEDQFVMDYWSRLTESVRKSYLEGSVYPPPKDIFRAYDLCPFDQVKVVIVGQDPYHGPSQANGLCFAVHDGITLPPSLKNIYKEIQSDIGVSPRPSGDLSRWATQGVLLLNSVLTVQAAKPASHAGLGWEAFTDATIDALNLLKENVVYLLWGKYAQKKGERIDRTHNLVLESAHPSPFSATLFHGNHHFSRCNAYLKDHGREPIDWS